MKTFNINDIIKVKLTDRGKDIFYHKWDEFNTRCGKEIMEQRYPDVDEDGFTKMQLWWFMWIYGRYMSLTGPQLIEHNDIYIYEKDLRDTEKSAFNDMIRAIQAIGVLSAKAKEAISKMEESIHKLEYVCDKNIDELTGLFAAGYTLTPPTKVGDLMSMLDMED